jgi:hypothetical protein
MKSKGNTGTRDIPHLKRIDYGRTRSEGEGEGKERRVFGWGDAIRAPSGISHLPGV